MTLPFKFIYLSICAGVSALPLVSHATQGTFPHGYGIKSEGMGGATLAHPQDSLVAASNSAGMVHLSNRIDGGLALLKVDNGTVFAGQRVRGTARRSLYVIPQAGFNYMLDEHRSIGLSIVGNGVGTGYSKKTNIGGLQGAGSEFQQMVATLTYAQKLNDSHSFGLGLMLLRQSLMVEGTRAVGLPQGKDKSYGAGIRIGYLGKLTENLSMGVSVSSKGYMQKMKHFDKLLAEGGRLDMPATAGLGFAYHIPGWTFAFDLQRVWWNQVRSLGNSGITRASQAPGKKNGPGFGWKNQTVHKLGVEWTVNEHLKVRSGYNKGDSILNKKDGYLALLAPSANHEHVSFGGTLRLDRKQEISIAYARSFMSKKNASGEGADGLSSPYMGQHWISFGYGVAW